MGVGEGDGVGTSSYERKYEMGAGVEPFRAGF